jgi:hypothetical protein
VAPSDTLTQTSRARATGCEHQVRHVGAGNQEEEDHRTHQRKADELDLPAVVALVERHHRRLDRGVGVGVVVRKAAGDGGQLGARLRHRDALREPGEPLEIARVAFQLSQPWHQRERLPEI